jgi:ATP phosphoribosyltransferase
VSGLTIAVPRGALFAGALDLLDRLGIDTAEIRSNGGSSSPTRAW